MFLSAYLKTPFFVLRVRAKETIFEHAQTCYACSPANLSTNSFFLLTLTRATLANVIVEKTMIDIGHIIDKRAMANETEAISNAITQGLL